MHSTFCYIFGLWHAGCTKNFCKPRKSLCTQQKRIQFPWSFYDRVIKKTVLDHDVIKAMEFSTKLFKEFKNLITFLVWFNIVRTGFRFKFNFLCNCCFILLDLIIVGAILDLIDFTIKLQSNCNALLSWLVEISFNSQFLSKHFKIVQLYITKGKEMF